MGPAMGQPMALKERSTATCRDHATNEVLSSSGMSTPRAEEAEDDRGCYFVDVSPEEDSPDVYVDCGGEML